VAQAEARSRTEPEHDLELASAMVAELEDYLHSPEVFWPLGQHAPPGRPAYPRLTLGGLQLVLDRLAQAEGSLASRHLAALARLRSELERIRIAHASALQRKAQAEQQSRLRLWRNFLADLQEGSASAAEYPHAVRQRVMAARLAEWAASPSAAGAMSEAAASADRRLRAVFRPGAFQWESRLQSIYPAEEYWYLYGGVR
jgi:hypothetical protein